jgi:hypothetical protein
VRTGRTAFWQIRCKGEPSPVFTWVHPVHGPLSSCESFTVMTEEYQGGATTTLVVHHADLEDRGTYTLQAENRWQQTVTATQSAFQEWIGEGGLGLDCPRQGPPRLRHVREGKQAVFVHPLLHWVSGAASAMGTCGDTAALSP